MIIIMVIIINDNIISKIFDSDYVLDKNEDRIMTINQLNNNL